MALLTPKSYDQLLAEVINTYQSKLGISDLAVGSAAFSLFETMAQIAYRTQGDIFQIKKDFSLDNAEEDALKKIAAEDRVYPIPAKVTTGAVTITDTSFVKKTTKVFAGAFAPNIGSLVIKASDTTGFPTTGSIYIGRGTVNIEGPLSYSSISQVGGHSEITLVLPTTKFHNISETITLAQGGVRTIPKAAVVKTVATGGTVSISFTTDVQTILLDGENIVTNVAVSAQQPGTGSNVTSNTIRQFSSPPFVGASVSNDTPFTNGKNPETDEEIRDRVLRARLSRGLGTATAIENATFGVQASDENASVISNKVYFDGVNTTLYIDNGNGYEAKTAGVGLEYIIDKATGGENSFQLATGGNQTSVAKAFLISLNVAPFQIYELDKLAILVGGIDSEHQFNVGDFRSPGNVTAYEIVSSINSNPNLLYTASTSNNGANVVIRAITEVSEYLQVTTPAVGTDASIALGFPVAEMNTLSLYKNRKLLEKDGRGAFIESKAQDVWLNSLSGALPGETLIVSVDGTAPITYNFTDADFILEGNYSILSKNNSISSWVNVINAKVTGLTASIDGNKLKITSNLGSSTRASIAIDSTCTFVSKGIFSTLSATGLAADYILSRNTAQIKLNKPLSTGDSLSVGTEFTKARIQSGLILGGAFSLLSDAYLWFLVDQANASIIPNYVGSNSLMAVSKTSTNVVRYTSNVSNAFAAVQTGDYAVIWSSELNANNTLEGRVYNSGSNFFELKVTPIEYGNIVLQSAVVWKEGICFVRTDRPLQKVKIPSGSHIISDISNTIQTSLYGALSYTQDDEIIFVGTETEGASGSIMLATFNSAAKSMLFTAGSDVSEASHYGYAQTAVIDSSFPSFMHSSITNDNISDPPNSEIASFTSGINLTNVEPNKMVSFLHPYNSVQDCQAAFDHTQISSLVSSTINISPKDTIRRLRVNDRFAVLEPLNFSHSDSVVVVIDNDTTNKTFPIPLYRKATVNTLTPVNPSNFRAYDSDSGVTTDFSLYFNSIDFSNYKVLMQAKNAINPANNSVDQDSILFRSTLWGKAGENINIGYIYPSSANQSISSSVSIGSTTDIRISLKSGAPIINTIDATTEWNVTVTINSPTLGVDTVTYSNPISGGTTPGLGSLVAGSFVTINSNGEFSSANTGTFRVYSSTATSFSTLRPTSSAVNESNKATLTSNTIFTYASSNTLASDIATYVNTSLSDYVSATLINDNGTTGSGIINLSTAEDSNFTYNSTSLMDGINWIVSANLSAIAPLPQFHFKKPLSLPTINTANIASYSFNIGENIRFIPTTASHVNDLLSILAVSGISTIANISNANRDNEFQITSSTTGSYGAVQIAGGNANSISSAIISNTSSLGNYIKATISKSSINGMQVGSFVNLTASQKQKKNIGITTTTGVTITPNSPLPGQSSIQLINRGIAEPYFGNPRNNFRDLGTTMYVEKHGQFICISWDSLSGAANFTKTVNVNGAAGGNISVTNNLDGTTTYTSVSNRSFIEAQVGDIFTIASLSNSSNNGTFNVMGITDDGLSICVDNANSINAASSMVLSVNLSISTQVKEGDLVYISAPFSTLNQGSFRVIRRFNNSIYIDNPNAIIETVSIPYQAISFGGGLDTSYDVVVAGTMKVQYNGTGTAPDFSNVLPGSNFIITSTNFSLGNRGSFLVVSNGVNYVELVNASATPQTNIVLSGIGGDIIKAHKPSLVFYDYETVVPGDNFVISGDVLSANNKGSYAVQSILNKNTIVVNSILVAQTGIGLAFNSPQVYIEESAPYVGYKRIANIAVDPASNSICDLVFDTNYQYTKINDTGSVQLTAMNKLSFPEVISVGVDSYKYNIGLIGEANRIVYGDPRNKSNYPGVAAAGAEIYIKEPLVRRVQVSINVRINTGVPFARIVDSVRNNVYSLINSSPIGQNIPLSNIIASVSSISGISSVVISSPLYDVTSDSIKIRAQEKPMMLNINTDISVQRLA